MDDEELGLKVMSGEMDRPGSHELPADMTPPVQDPGTTKALTDTDKRRLAEQIDERVTTLLKEGGTDIDIFVGMADYMADFKWLMGICSPSEMHSLCARYDGFYRYAKTLEEIAQGIKDGDIPVP